MEKKILIFMTAVLVLLLAAFIFIPGPDKTEKTGIETNSENVKVYNLAAGQKIKSPFILLGEARLWYFEGSFGGYIADADGVKLSSVVAQAKGEWMSTSSVSFEAKVEFPRPLTPTGFIYLSEDDPSGMNKNLEYIKIPISFEEYETETREVKIFLLNEKLDSEITCEKVFPVTRKIPNSPTVGQAALERLIIGPTDAEVADGYTTTLNSGIKINSLRIENGIASVDFNEFLGGGGGSCRVTAVRAQITETLKQFPTVQEVKISINGNSEDILQP